MKDTSPIKTNINLKKAKVFRFKGIVAGGLVCPYCNKWLAVQITEKLVSGVIRCRECHKRISIDKETCNETNERNTRIREILCYGRIRRTVYEGYKNGKTRSKK